MDTSIRAKRILTQLGNYQAIDLAQDRPSSLSDVNLGTPIGRYRNSDVQNDVIWIFENGLAWFERDQVTSLRFDELAEVMLPDGKESERLQLKTKDGKPFQLPVRGHRGRFLDSLEMLRFLDRVMQDMQKASRSHLEH